MGTRGFVGIKSGGSIRGYYNHFDSYYSNLGIEVLDAYFKDGSSIPELASDSGKGEEQDGDFLQDGLYCEYGYVWNVANDTLEIYRGFFKTRQLFPICDNGYATHLIFVVDKKIHTKELVKKAFNKYEQSRESGKKKEELYPERRVINVCLGCLKPVAVNKKYHNKKCENMALVGDI